MKNFTSKIIVRLSIGIILLFASTSFAQVKPLLQDIKVAEPAPTPLVNKTGSSSPKTADVVNPGIDNVSIPGYSGILIETLEGKVVKESYSNTPFNPASNVKVATAYAVLKTFGPDYRFPTNIWTDGRIDRFNGVLIGNLYVSGRDPVFNYEHGVALANELNGLGIRQVTGDLIVTDNFVMNYNAASLRAGQTLAATMDAAKRSSAATRAWQSYVTTAKKLGKVQANPSVSFGGGVYVQSMPTNARLMFSHESTPMREILKVTLCFSNNFLSERLGDMLGGAYAVSKVVQMNAQIPPNEFILQTSSGLGINRVTPNAMMKLLRVLRSDLAKYKMSFADIMPVAGIDDGTLENRFNSPLATGSVVGKTGTLGRTDGGASSLAGEINTKQGKLLFVIFNQRGNVNTFRSFQNSYVSLVQSYFGGGVPMKFNAIPLDERMAKTRISYPQRRDEDN